MWSHTIENNCHELVRLNQGRHHNPFNLLGKHNEATGTRILVLLPFAIKAKLITPDVELQRVPQTDLFEVFLQETVVPDNYQIEWLDDLGNVHKTYDPYHFPPQITDYDLHLYGEGKNRHTYRFLGAHPRTINNIPGVLFAVWAPNAERVSVVGNFNRWNGRCNPMRSRGSTGIWELFIPELNIGELYKFEIRQRETGKIMVKTDPYARHYELRPGTAAIVSEQAEYPWQDKNWLEQRASRKWLHEPMSIYEIHLGSWRFIDDTKFPNYRELAHQLVEYIKPLGFTHIELLPITEHPFDGSWGYQTTGYFAPTSRFGTPEDFKYFVDYCHQHDLGILLDWVPGHFPKDDFALANFDGTPLFEHEDPRRGEHRDWGTLIFNYGRNEVKNFLISSALFWLKEFHLDGLRVDAVASMLYLDYSRENNDWLPNIYGSNENLEAIEFLRELNQVTHSECPGILTIAEESTAWPQVTRPPWLGGLGFSMKWNMGWMHDSLEYMSKDPVHRHYHHNNLTFGLLYAFTENFVLPYSHDEVVHGKGPMIYKMPGDEWQRFANLRLLYTFMFTYPGKKILFMGCEFAQTNEWNHENFLDWHLLKYDFHKGTQSLVRDLNQLYCNTKALYHFDFEEAGFEWIDCNDSSQSVISYIRRFENEKVIVVLNFTPMVRENYRIGVPEAGQYTELFNSDSTYYGGSNVGNQPNMHTTDDEWMGRPHTLNLTLPPLAALVLKKTNNP